MANTDVFLQGLKLLADDAYFRSLAETIPHTLIVIDVDTYRVQYINRLQYGYNLEDVIGREVFDFVWPNYIDAYRRSIETIKKDRRPIVFELEGESALHETGKAWYRTHISVLPGPDNTITSLLLLAEDITDSKLKEIEIYDKSEKLKAIINNTNDIICSLDLNYNITEFNSLFSNLVMKGFNMVLEPGMPVLRFMDPNKHQHQLSIYNRVKAGEIVFDVQSYDTILGHTVYNESSYHPIVNLKNEIIGISVFSKDITDRMKHEKEMEKALKEKEVLLSEIHHRIKNNLAIVSSLLQLQEINMIHPEAREALILSRKRIKSTALIHELLYRSDSFEFINLHEYIKELFQHLKFNDSIILSLSGDPVTLDLNKALPLGLMLNEIMLNSFKHSYKDVLEGKTDISTRFSTNGLEISYCDCKGNFPDTIDFNNPSSTGLTLIHTFAEQLGGNIQLISKSPPKYKITIPSREQN